MHKHKYLLMVVMLMTACSGATFECAPALKTYSKEYQKQTLAERNKTVVVLQGNDFVKMRSRDLFPNMYQMIDDYGTLRKAVKVCKGD